MFDYKRFDHVFPPSVAFPYERKILQEIDTFRKGFEGALFIDRVLRALGITKAKVYPPKTENAFKALHQQICEANMTTHHRLSIFYYILLDYDYLHTRSGFSEAFAQNSGVPKKYQIFMKGLWHLDRQQFDQALEYIAHPSLIPDFADDIIAALVRHAPEGDYSLALSYYYTVQPILKTSHALELLFDAMARTSVADALAYSRSHPESTRKLLFERLVVSALRTQAAVDVRHRELVGLPLDTDEDAWLEDYILLGDGRKLKDSKDVLLRRYIWTSRFTEASKLKGVSEQWEPTVASLRLSQQHLI